jgi:hypothetical protein
MLHLHQQYLDMIDEWAAVAVGTRSIVLDTGGLYRIRRFPIPALLANLSRADLKSSLPSLAKSRGRKQ